MKPSEDVVARRVEDEVVLVNLKTNQIYALNRTGARAWELFEAGNDQTQIAAGLRKEFDVREEDLDGELERLFVSLREEGLVDG